MSEYKIVLLPGDGIGKEVMSIAETIVKTAASRWDLPFTYQSIPCGGQFYLEHGSRDWPEGSEETCAQADLILLGAVGWSRPGSTDPVMMADGKMAGWNAVIGNRTRLDLYANYRPVKLYPGVKHRIHGKVRQVWDTDKVDMAFVRENTEGLYIGAGGILNPGNVEKAAVDARLVTREGSERVIRYAYELCRRRSRGAPADGKKRITSIGKENVLKGCQMFLRIFREIGKEYPEIERENAIVDAMTQWLITQPEHYDVLVTTNMFGDILTDLASVLQGGMGMAVGGNIGDNNAMFEPIHGSAPPLAGKDEANPMAMILAAAEGLMWLGDRKNDPKVRQAGEAIEKAVVTLLKRGEPLTVDLAGSEKGAPASRVGEAVCDLVTNAQKSELGASQTG